MKGIARKTGEDWKESLKLITRVHVWMLERILPFPGVTMPDGYARSMFAAVRRGINDFRDCPPVPFRPALQANLVFMDTDLLRLSNMNMRYMQALELIRSPREQARDAGCYHCIRIGHGLSWLDAPDPHPKRILQLRRPSCIFGSSPRRL